MEAAFVDIGMEKNGFLYAGDILVDKTDFGLDPQALEQELKSLSIKKLLKVGQEILVQVIKEPGGKQGPPADQPHHAARAAGGAAANGRVCGRIPPHRGGG